MTSQEFRGGFRKKFMKFRLVFICTILSGCAVVDTVVAPELQPYAPNLALEAAQDSPSIGIVSNQKEPYASIINANYQEMKFAFDHNIQTLRIARLGNKQSRLPQIEPSVGVTTNDTLDVTLGFRQVLYDGGVYQAQYASDDHEAVYRQVKLFRELNENASSEIETFIAYKENQERYELLTELSAHVEDLYELADTRVKGGISTESESSLFSLKLSEIRTDARIAESDAQADRVVLKEYDLDGSVASFTFAENRLPLDVLEATAKMNVARSEYELAKKEAIPQVVLDAYGGYSPVTGRPSSEIGIVVEADPISLGGNVDIQAAEQAYLLSRNDLKQIVEDAEQRKTKLVYRIKALEQQLEETDNLTQQARVRFDRFSEEFHAGSASFTEAAGLFETLKQSLESRISLKYRIVDFERQLAEIEGHFWKVN